MNNKNSSYKYTSIKILLILCSTLVLGGFLLVAVYFPVVARNVFGIVYPDLTLAQRISLPIKLVMRQNDLMNLHTNENEGCIFSIMEGESVYQIANRLQEETYITSADVWVDYTIYTGIDRQIQIGSFCIPNPSTGSQIAKLLADPQARMIKAVILPGWRLEEIGESIEALSVNLHKDELLLLDQNPSNFDFPDELGKLHSLEGYLSPGEYLITQKTNTVDFAQLALDQFVKEMNPEIMTKINNSGFALHQVLIIASLVQREAQHDDEMPMIASVFLNRISIGMKFESDPTVQYALGFQPDKQTWWKVPLTFEDLRFNSPYNTYIYSGYPPTPICSPSTEAVNAVLEAPTTNYLFFRAACDNTGYHQFSVTFDEHLAKECP